MGRKEGVPRGFVPVLVGQGAEMERFLVHTKLFKDPCFMLLLEMAAQEFGYDQQGILQIPCDAKHFRALVDPLPALKAKS